MAVPPPRPADIAAAKRALREAMRARRTRFADGPEGAPAAAALRARLRPALDRCRGVLAGYLALRGEPDVLHLLLEAHGRGLAVALPRLRPGEPLRFARWTPGAMLARGPLGTIQPAADAPGIEPDTLVMPLVAWDRAGRRLGQGGGYYDGWCASHPDALRIGAAWSVQEADAVPTEQWDVPLHGLATEREWIGF